MRFLLFDRIVNVEQGRTIRGLKAISLTDPAFESHYARQPLYPGALVIESMIQLLGWLAIRRHDFRLSAVLSVLEGVQVPTDLGPGVLLSLEGELTGTNARGSVGRAWARIDGKEVAHVQRVIYAHVPTQSPEQMEARFRAYGGLG